MLHPCLAADFFIFIMMTKDEIAAVAKELSVILDIDSKFNILGERLQNVESSLKKLTRRVRDIESDQRTTQAIGRLVQDAGLSFKDTRIPYPLQGNAAIEDIKDYY
uniref:hypothetical protein n=1 Tax=Candidatus Electronema sp. TaxID=2698783 RepID=UPI004056CE8B